MVTQDPKSEFEYEISIGDIVEKLWRRLGLIFSITLLGVFCGLAIALLFSIRTKPVVAYYVDLPGINNSTYPNETPFSPQDLLSPEVLSQVANVVGIEDQESLRQALNVEFNSPVAEGIAKKYAAQLNRRGLAAADINQINARYTDELKRSTESSLRLSFHTGELSIGVLQAKDILIQIPQTWSKVFTTRFRVLDDTRLPGATIEQVKDLDTSIGAINAEKLLDSVQNGLTLLSEDNRLAALQTKAGLTPADLSLQISNLSDVYLSPAIVSQLSTENIHSKLYFNFLRLQVAEIDTELAGFRSTIGDIRAIMDQQQTIPSEGLKTQDGSSLQVDSSALGDILSLANQVSLAEYLKELFEKRQDLISKKVKLETRINRSSGDALASVPFVEHAQTRLNKLILSYNELLTRARSIIRSEYVVLHRPFGDPIELRTGIIAKVAQIGGAGLMLGLFFAFLSALVLPTKRRS